MAVDIQAWLRTQRRAICAPPSAVEAKLENGTPRLQYIVQRIYPILLRAGYEIPLNIVVDLACLYLDGPDVEFRRPSTWPTDSTRPTDQTLAERYCRSLRDDTARGPFRDTITAARRALRQRITEERKQQTSVGSAQKAKDMLLRPGETKATAGLLTFLELCAAGLCRDSLLVSMPDEVRVALVQGNIVVPSEKGQVDKQAVEFLSSFLRALFPNAPNGQEDLPRTFGQAFEREASSLLTVSSAHVAAGAEGLDLPVLQACLNYQPISLTDIQAARYKHLRRTLSPRQNRSARSPECGNHGITTKGNETAVLHSYLARDDFIERVYLHQVLYWDRYAAQLEPHRVLLAWILDRGRAMQARTPTGQRRDAVARQLAAHLLEDAVRYFNAVPALDLRVAVLLHNGERREGLRGRMITPPPELLRQAPSAETFSKAKCRAWLPKVDGFLPHYLLREPIWPEANGDNQRNPFARTNQDMKPYRRALEVLTKVAGLLSDEQTEAGVTYVYDLCHVVAFGTAEELPSQADVKECGDTLRCVSRIAARASVNFFACGSEAVTFRTWPPLAAKHFSNCQEENYTDLHDGSIRRVAWDDLLERLWTL